ncbi:MAG: tRNA (adenosine(37)-N6)-threonylcarbamoyltransferase complex ATPase subunit type 1 TsaE [Leptolyngbya sp. IPPAS B-1204]|nr:MAG: tRNA (adenosine(37)-N6)-threonylcarbamoyltransferase complex ATPase subunit type 1 TsaE [Leptolyngbya sp. IPPAS B-1204]
MAGQQNSKPVGQIRLADEPATRQLGFELGQRLPAGIVLLLNGDLGSGKTTLVQGLGQGLGIAEPIVSPTFTLISEYPEGRVPLYHLDLYRLQPEEVDELYVEAYWSGSEYPLGIVAIEWAERLLHRPSEYLQIDFTILDAGRLAQLQAVGAFHQQILQQLEKLGC